MQKAMILFLWLGGTFFSCSNSVSPSRTSSEVYKEDLSGYRPKVGDDLKVVRRPSLNQAEAGPAPSHDITDQLSSTLDSLAAFNKRLQFVDGYRIQVYSGPSREEAIKLRNQVNSNLSVARPVVEYDQPNYKVKVGEFSDRLEAQKIYADLKEDFPNAIVVPAQIKLQE